MKTLKGIWKYVSGKGDYVPSHDMVIRVLPSILGLYHVCLLMLFSYCKMHILVVVNVVSVLIYGGCLVASRMRISTIRIHQVFHIEVMLQVLFAGILLGPACGFQFYLIAEACHAFYVGFAYRDSKKVNAMHYVIFDVIAFFALQIASARINGFYSFEHLSTAHTLYAVNFMTAMIVIVMTMGTLLTQICNLESKLLKQNKDLEILSRTDALTGLVNRRSIEENYEYVMENSKMYALIMADIDDFKIVNDTYGHNVGDAVLKQAADIFLDAVREDDMVCRWGGEEILVFLPLCPKEGAARIAGRIMDRIRKVRVKSKGGEEINFTMTFGIADSTEGENFKEVIQMTDTRMYEGKANGKNCIVCE